MNETKEQRDKVKENGREGKSRQAASNLAKLGNQSIGPTSGFWLQLIGIVCRGRKTEREKKKQKKIERERGRKRTQSDRQPSVTEVCGMKQSLQQLAGQDAQPALYV